MEDSRVCFRTRKASRSLSTAFGPLSLGMVGRREFRIPFTFLPVPMVKVMASLAALRPKAINSISIPPPLPSVTGERFPDPKAKFQAKQLPDSDGANLLCRDQG